MRLVHLNIPTVFPLFFWSVYLSLSIKSLMLLLLFRYLKETHTLTPRRSAALMRSWPSLSGCIQKDGRLLASGWGWRSWDVIFQVRKCTWHHLSITDDTSVCLNVWRQTTCQTTFPCRIQVLGTQCITWSWKRPLGCSAVLHLFPSSSSAMLNVTPVSKWWTVTWTGAHSPRGLPKLHKEKPGGCWRQPVALTLCPHHY